ncbi:Flagellar basal-body P-ring formation protein FlgA [Pseudoalteromonas luteoviolacea B = ATCC 29581]|nr:Flagellar basal-body P-ring formation protein FlgA [Pseudoalteromonas luteoviolacea B = ATCC 29581]
MSVLKKSRWSQLIYFFASFSIMTQGYAKTYSPDMLEQQAVQFINSYVENEPDKRIEVRALPLEFRQTEKICNSPLELSTPSEPPFNRQVTVQLKCLDTLSWTQYVHVRIEELHPMVVALSPIARGAVISAQDIQVQFRAKYFVRATYFEQTDDVVGSRSKRTISAGMPITSKQICMVCKGDKVTISANQSNLSIRTSGLALEDGNFGELIRVENTSSGKTLRARVSGVESVEVNL